MIGLLQVLLGIALQFIRWRVTRPASNPTKPISLRKARRLARQMAALLEHSRAAGRERRQEIVKALTERGVPETLARIVTEGAAARYSLKG